MAGRLAFERPFSNSMQLLVDGLIPDFGLIFNVRAQNPNPFKMPIDKLNMSVKVNNNQLGGVNAPGGLTMNPGQPLTIPLRVNASLAAIGLTAAQLLQHPSLRYNADMNFKSGPLQLPAKANGSFRL